MTMPHRPFALLDFPAPRLSRRLFEDPLAVLSARTPEEVAPLLDAVERAALDGAYAVGFVAYEAAPGFDSALHARPAHGPLAWFALFDHSTPAPMPATPDLPCMNWQPQVPPDEYAAAVESLRDAIGRGDVYQVNLTFPLHAAAPLEPLALYEAVRTRQPGYCAYLDLGATQVVSFSPELFFERAGERITMRPMKGTRRRGRWPAEDAARAAELAESAKDRAENLMIVDLIRNDLGRIARFGSVTVPRLFDIEAYDTVFQMTSTVTAHVQPDVKLREVFGALFPSGSVTGAPKVSAMRFIAQHERAPRGVYCGALGVVEPGGNATFNVAIRTLRIDEATRRATYGVGGGITWDSTSSAEYDEAISKAAVLEAPRTFELIETLRLDHGRIPRLDRHIARLDASSVFFGRWPAGAALRAELAACARAHPEGVWRLRALAGADGSVTVQRSGLEPLPREPRVALAARAVRSEDTFLFHKTTARARYEADRAERPELFDVLYYNERGELTEFTRGNVVLELDGVRVTPARECGLLAGTFRAELLENGTIREDVVAVDRLQRASRLWLINSVRECVEVIL